MPPKSKGVCDSKLPMPEGITTKSSKVRSYAFRRRAWELKKCLQKAKAFVIPNFPCLKASLQKVQRFVVTPSGVVRVNLRNASKKQRRL
jgi:hypothetical protein